MSNKYYYYAAIDSGNLGLALFKIKFIKEAPTKNLKFIYGEPELLWVFGGYNLEDKDKANFFRADKLHDDLTQAIERLYSLIDNLNEILELRKSSAMENVKYAEEFLNEEKKNAQEAIKKYKRFTNSFKNLNIERILENKGII